MLKKIVLLVVAICFPLNLYVNWHYSQALYDLGVALIMRMQQYSFPVLDYFFVFFTVLVDPMLIISIACLYILFAKQKMTAFITVIFTLFNTYFLTISKSFYSAPRPYWTHHSVRNIGYYCPKDYGNPSGHAEFAAIMGAFILQFLDRKRQLRYAVLAAFFMVTVSISRMYLGAHSLDQVVQGLFLGVSLSILYAYGGLKESIRDLLIKQRRRNYRLILFGLIAAMHALYIWAYWANNQAAVRHKKAAKVWVQNYNQKCGKDIDEHYLNAVMLNLNAVLVNIITGLTLGFNQMLKARSFVPFMKGQWKVSNKKYSKFVSYGIYFFIQVALFSVGFIVYSPILVLFGKNSVSLFIYMNLSALTSSYVYSAYTLNVLAKSGVIEIDEQTPKLQ